MKYYYINSEKQVLFKEDKRETTKEFLINKNEGKFLKRKGAAKIC